MSPLHGRSAFIPSSLRRLMKRDSASRRRAVERRHLRALQVDLQDYDEVVFVSRNRESVNRWRYD